MTFMKIEIGIREMILTILGPTTVCYQVKAADDEDAHRTNITCRVVQQHDLSCRNVNSVPSVIKSV
jgi:hypothetical protein